MPHGEGKRQSSIFRNSNFYLFSITGKMAEIKSQLEIDFYRTREGKSPFNNAEGNTKKNIIPEELQKYIQ